MMLVLIVVDYLHMMIVSHDMYKCVQVELGDDSTRHQRAKNNIHFNTSDINLHF